MKSIATLATDNGGKKRKRGDKGQSLSQISDLLKATDNFQMKRTISVVMMLIGLSIARSCVFSFLCSRRGLMRSN